MRMERHQSQLLIVDVQDKLAPHIETVREVVANSKRLAAYARRMGVPTTLSEHYPKGLGPTVGEVKAEAGNETPALEKIAFSCWQDAGLRARLGGLRDAGRTQIVVAGMEAHVCVCQTVLDLVADGADVYLVADAVGSRKVATRDLAIDRMRAAGATIVSHEMVAFEWLARGDAAETKDIIALVK